MGRSSCWLVSQGVAALLMQAVTVAAQTADSATTAVYDPMAGYTPVSDVIEHSELDLDILDMETNVDLLDAAGMTAAYTAYSVGGNSAKTTETRTVQGFSTGAQEKLTGETYFDIWAAYWEAPDYADVFTSSACQGTGDFAGETIIMRSESCLKGAQYQNVWMYVIHELEDAVNDCNNGDLTANDGGPHAWDEGWAFYTGSIEGATVGGSADGGQMLYALAEKRCENFDTCGTNGVSAINTEILDLWTVGQQYLLDGECAEAEALIAEIVPLMAVPLVQGLLRYTYLADPAVGTGGDKEASELWAFSAAILPWIDHCDPAVATTVRANSDITLTTSPMSDGYLAVKEAIESVYTCMGITCAQVGGLLAETTGYVAGFAPCTEAADGTAATSDSAATPGTYDDIAGYAPVSDVVEHSELDLDVLDMETNVDLLDAAGMTAAYTAYSVGGNSEKTTEIRTIQGFSTGAQEKLTGETYFDIWAAYWEAPDYADVFTSSACQGTGDFAGETIIMRSESCLKGAQYQNIWMYVIHELEDAVNDCNNGDLTANDGGPHAWDEGWAFYAGSIEGTAVGGSADGGQMLYALAEKRCENFDTCGTNGVSAINTEILDLWTAGQQHLLDGECAEAEALIAEIVPLMAVPLVQGLLRYTYLADPAVGTGGDKEASELWAFSAAILPWIDHCDPAVATTVRANSDITLTTSPMSDGYLAVKEAIESVYTCMGITCAQVGGLLAETTGYVAGFAPCTEAADGTATSDSAATPVDSGADTATGTYDDIAGYAPVSDVIEHSELDLDVLDMETNVDLLDEAGMTAAYTAYSVGGNSAKTTSTRTIQAFSTEAQEKLTGETYFEIWSDFWESPDYADVFTSSACEGTGAFEGTSFDMRSESCLKGAQYQNIWMYVIHELEDAVNDCNNGDLTANDGGPHAWDEGWAFYAGSIEGTAVGGSTDGGQMLYALAEKRCENFGTCTGDADGDATSGVSAINTEILDLWHTGQRYLLDGECAEAEALIAEIVPLMAVPLVQGLLRYTYLADPAGGAGGDKEASELWAFSAAILPWINHCDPAAATVVRDNTDIELTTSPMSAGYSAVKAEIESVYSCMGITCAQVGGLLAEDSTDYIAGFEPCEDGSSGGGTSGSDASDEDSGGTARAAGTDGGSDSGELSAGGIAGVTIAVGAVAAIGVVAFVLLRKRKKASSAVDDNLGNF